MVSEKRPRNTLHGRGDNMSEIVTLRSTCTGNTDS